jgi:hypothetical protein
MARERTGSIQELESGKYLVRVTYFDSRGKRHDLRRLVETRTDAKELRKKLLRDLDDHGHELIDGEKLTFAKLAEIYTAHNYSRQSIAALVEPVWRPRCSAICAQSVESAKFYICRTGVHFQNYQKRETLRISSASAATFGSHKRLFAEFFPFIW